MRVVLALLPAEIRIQLAAELVTRGLTVLIARDSKALKRIGPCADVVVLGLGDSDVVGLEPLVNLMALDPSIARIVVSERRDAAFRGVARRAHIAALFKPGAAIDDIATAVLAITSPRPTTLRQAH